MEKQQYTNEQLEEMLHQNLELNCRLGLALGYVLDRLSVIDQKAVLAILEGGSQGGVSRKVEQLVNRT